MALLASPDVGVRRLPLLNTVRSPSHFGVERSMLSVWRLLYLRFRFERHRLPSASLRLVKSIPTRAPLLRR
jgi:hypothetical protein